MHVLIISYLDDMWQKQRVKSEREQIKRTMTFVYYLYY